MTKTDKSFKFIPVEVFWSQEDDGYIARPQTGYLNMSGFGLTRSKAIKELETAMEGL